MKYFHVLDRSRDRERSPRNDRYKQDQGKVTTTAYAHLKSKADGKMPPPNMSTGRIRGPRPISPPSMSSGYNSTVVNMTRPMSMYPLSDNYNSTMDNNYNPFYMGQQDNFMSKHSSNSFNSGTGLDSYNSLSRMNNNFGGQPQSFNAFNNTSPMSMIKNNPSSQQMSGNRDGRYNNSQQNDYFT